jgi:tRNA A-37 threonylcarbamoyl transferase component Bud32
MNGFDSNILAIDSMQNMSNNYFSMKLTSIANISELKKKTPSRRKLNKNPFNKSEQIRPYNNFYTTLNNSIKYIADIVYQEIGEGENNNRMSYNNFEKWISRNEGILKTFDKWLRKEIWGDFEVMIPSSSSIPEVPAPMNGYIRVNMKKKSQRVKLYSRKFLELHTNILTVYNSSNKTKLINVFILKDLNITFNETNLKIKIFHLTSLDYLNLTLVFKNRSNFSQWKEALKCFNLESVEKFYSFREKIGRGSFSTVNLCEKKNQPNKKFAIKTIDKQLLKTQERNLIQEEAKIIKGLSHENIIKFYDHFEDYKKTYYVFEFVEGGDLMEYVLGKKRIEEREARRVFKQLLRVIRYIHKSNILHRDIKPENIMVEVNPTTKEIDKIKLIDFGFATFFSKDNLPTLSCGTLNYAAPEVLVGEEYDESSDLFSCGVILYFM